MKIFLRGHPAPRVLRTQLAVRVVAAALSAALIAFGAGAWSRLATRTKHEATPLVLPLRSAEVRHIAVESGDREVELTRASDGSWSGVSGAPPGSEALMSNVEDRLFPLGAYRTLRADTAAPQYGLVDPEITFRVEDAGGNEHRVLLGAPTFTAGGVYARRGTDAGRVYLVPRRMMDDLRSLLAGQRVDAPNDLPRKVRELTKEKAQAEKDKVSWWLRQVLDAGTPVPEGPK